jgi:hypothetical protein
MSKFNIAWLQVFFQAMGVIVTFYFSRLVFNLHKRKNDDDAKLQKPIVNIHNFQDIGYVIVNIGKGPALNIRFAECSSTGQWERAIIGYSIPVNTFFATRLFFNHYGAIAVAYNDTLGKHYLMVAKAETTTIFEKGSDGFYEDLFKHLHNNPVRTDKLPLLSKL